ncbi:MAG TPA: hypothetical protein VGO03_03205, partial [Acidimicrobiia bacterium]
MIRPVPDPISAAAAFVRQPGVGDRGPIAVVRDGADVIVGTDAVEQVAADGEAGLRALDRMWLGDGFWVGALAYDLGRTIEPAAPAGAPADSAPSAPHDDRGFADVAFTRFATQHRFTPDPARRASSD